MAPFSFVVNFENYLRTEKRNSEHTTIAYVKDLEQFLEFAGVLSNKDLREVNHKLVRGWLVNLIESGLTNKSANRKLSSLRTFFKFAKKSNWIEFDPMVKVRGPKSEKRLPHFAKEEELSIEITDSVFSDDFFGMRDRLMVEVFYQTGIRLTELIGLKDKDVSSNSIKVLGKRNKERIIPVSNDLAILMTKYLQFKAQIGFDEAYFFVNDKGNKLYPKFVYRKINSYLGRVTNLEQCSPHVLRHTFATHMLNSGAGLETLKVLLGHASLSATQVYTHNSFTQLNHIYSQAHPRGHKK